MREIPESGQRDREICRVDFTLGRENKAEKRSPKYSQQNPTNCSTAVQGCKRHISKSHHPLYYGLYILIMLAHTKLHTDLK